MGSMIQLDNLLDYSHLLLTLQSTDMTDLLVIHWLEFDQFKFTIYFTSIQNGSPLQLLKCLS